ncbi:MAG: hypothetical protein HYU83_00745, partial [Chloroflexi bacterium]|nr:hypothetical protein [Chloroflexota bacterium]
MDWVKSGKLVIYPVTIAGLVYLSLASVDEEFEERFSFIYHQEHEVPFQHTIPQFYNTAVAVANTTG